MYGKNSAAYIQSHNTENTKSALYVEQKGTGTAATFKGGDGVYIHSIEGNKNGLYIGNVNSTNNALYVYQKGSGNAARFGGGGGVNIDDVEGDNNGLTIIANTNSSYSALCAEQKGSGNAAYFVGRVEIKGGHTESYSNYGWLARSGSGNTSGSSGSRTYSLHANGRIVCPEFNATSDMRIKDIMGESDNYKDMQILQRIKVFNYSFKDTFLNGSRYQKKVVGQQIGEVFPEAVNICTDVVPDIFQHSKVEKGWVVLPKHNLKPKERVKILADGLDAKIYIVEDCTQDSFKIDLEYTGEVFVYGREVDDFHVVDYDALSILNISATQEICNIIGQLQAEIQELKSQLHEAHEGQRSEFSHH
jgi:uncharacterized small protein (DUF1192 family)